MGAVPVQGRRHRDLNAFEVRHDLDAEHRTDEEVFVLLNAQQHRRWIKTHTPLDGLPLHPTVTYVAMIRHPLDVALSDRDHRANQNRQRAHDLRLAATGPPEVSLDRGPDDVAGYVRWFIDNDLPATGSGPNGLGDFCEQVTTYWTSRHLPNVHLFHYQDLWDDLDGEMRRVADCLGITIDEQRWSSFVEAATLDSMRSRADDTAPDAHLGLWHDTTDFFRSGGTREWTTLLTDAELDHFHERLEHLAADATNWVLAGRTAIPQ